jgi:high-affinity nickel-transport protein
MQALPTDTLALSLLVFLLGCRHGLDADHLATIDGLTRLNARHRFARWCGVLFALGHGAVVLLVAALVGRASREATPPPWLEALGAWVSITCLALIGAANLHALLRAAAGQPVPMVGLKGRLLGPLRRTGHPGGVALVGALFALSLDTLGQAALFGMAGAQHGAAAPLLLGGLFALGMALVDGANGLWVHRLIACADHAALVASRVVSAVVAGMSLALAVLGGARRLWPALDDWHDGHALSIGIVLIAWLVAGSALAQALRRIHGAAPPARQA